MTSHYEWYDKWIDSSKSSACVVRMTNQCDQRCKHCCFRSGPDQIGQLSVKTCGRINAWVPKKVVLNIMGGEFSVLDNYPEMLVAISRGRSDIRLVTNGFWASDNPNKFYDAIKQMQDAGCPEIDVVVSHDSWHGKHGDLAISLLEANNTGITLIKTGELGVDDITPIGRAWDNGIAPNGNIQCSCQSMCNMIITEDGMLGRCPFGYMPWKHFSETTWADAQDYIWGWRSEKLAEGMNCHLCMEIVKASKSRGLDS